MSCPMFSLTLRGSQVTSLLNSSFAMQLLGYVAFFLLCRLPFLFPSKSNLQCNETQYSWPVETAKLCCDKCPPGKHMARRPDESCTIECKLCEGERYIHYYNVAMNCEFCRSCNKSNMEYKSRCKTDQNAVCRCKAGYRCRDPSCTQCVPKPPTTKSTLPPSTTTSTPEALTTLKPTKSVRETVWFLVIIALLCIGIALVIVTKIKPFLSWIRAKDCK
nr:PREDICTED: CD27 antigen [Paralichthys olivaceus]